MNETVDMHCGYSGDAAVIQCGCSGDAILRCSGHAVWILWWYRMDAVVMQRGYSGVVVVMQC